MNALDAALVATAVVLLVVLILRVIGANPNVPLWGVTPWILLLAVLAEGFAKVHLTLPATVSPVDEATLWVFVWALLLQVTAGVIAVVNEELDFGVSIRDEPMPYSQGRIGGIRGGGSGIFWWIYTSRVQNNIGDGRGGNRYEDTRLYSPPSVLSWEYD